MSTLSTLIATWNRFWFRPAEPYALAVGRMVIAYAVLMFLLGSRWAGTPVPNWSALGSLNFKSRYATYAENDVSLYFPVSYLELLGVPPPTQTALTLAFAAAFFGAWMLAFGLASRTAASVTAVSMLYLLAMVNSWGKVNHGYHVLGLVLVVLAFSRCGDAWSLDSLLRRRSPKLRAVSIAEQAWEYRWPITAMQMSWALMFFFAGWNKLMTSGLEWAFSENMRNTLVYQNYLVRDWETASWPVRMAVEIDHSWLWYALGTGALATELFFVGIVFVWRWKWVRRAFLLAGGGLVLGLDVLMQLPNPSLLVLLILFVDWNGIRSRLSGSRKEGEVDNLETGDFTAATAVR